MPRWNGPLSLAVAVATMLPAGAAAATGPDLAPYPTPPASVAAAADTPAPPAAAPAADPPCTGWYALTFDDGPTESTPQLLAALKAQNIKATFFVTGQHASGLDDDGTADPVLAENLKAEIADGHTIANHSWSHPALVNGSNAAYAEDMGQTLDPITGQPYGSVELSDQQIRDQLNLTNAAITAAGAPAPTFVRPPYGEWILGTRDLSAPGSFFDQAGLKNTMWTVDTRDAMGTDTAPTATDAIVNGVLNPSPDNGQIADGGIILMHDGYANTITALPQVVSGLRAKGLCPGKLAVSSTPLQAYNGPFYVKAVDPGTTPPPPPADTTKPTITFVAPAQNVSYTVGQVINADYQCQDNVGVTECTGSIASGSALDTATEGAKTFTVTAKDAAGNTETITRAYNVALAADTTAPIISVTSPQDGAHYAQGQSVTASYSCTDDRDAAPSCAGTVANEAALDTSSAGTKSYKVDAKDAAGNAASSTVSYVVDAPPAPPEQPPVQLPSNPKGPPPVQQPSAPPVVVPASKPRAPVLSKAWVTNSGRPATVLSLTRSLRLNFRVDRAAVITVAFRQKSCHTHSNGVRHCGWFWRRTEKFSVPSGGSYSSHILRRRTGAGTLPRGDQYYVYVTASNAGGSSVVKMPIRVQ